MCLKKGVEKWKIGGRIETTRDYFTVQTTKKSPRDQERLPVSQNSTKRPSVNVGVKFSQLFTFSPKNKKDRKKVLSPTRIKMLLQMYRTNSKSLTAVNR